MSRIRLLPETVASQVAAGEVVERPASVVKELIENSVDAGARKIDTVIRRGGISLVRVIDDGCGMDRDDALLSLERHATSKIRSAADLQAVATLGFRGEALPSIASVSRFRLTTREGDEVAGTEIVVNGGKIDIVRDGGEAPGTQVEVRSLFYNLPARRKFLRSENTESRNIEHQIHLQAIGHANVAFTFARDDRVVFQLPATASLTDRVRDLYGNELLTQLLPISGVDSTQTKISGLIGQAGLSRQTRSQQLIFVNGRAIESPVITAAIREGYHTALMKGQYAVTFLFVEIDPGSAEAHNTLGSVYIRRGQLEQASSELEEAIRLQPEFAGAHYNLALVLKKQEKRDEAAQELRAALKADPQFQAARAELDRMEASTKR